MLGAPADFVYAQNYLRGDQYLSPLPYADSFHSESYYEPQPSHGGQLGDYAVPTPAAPSHSQGGSYDSYTKRASGEDRQLAPLVKPWLASTASTTLVSPLTEFNMASWSRGLLA